MLGRREMLKMILMEELGEFAQAISKTVRFTDSHKYPEYEHTNAETAQLEFNDVLALCEMVQNDELPLCPDPSLIKAKKKRVEETLIWSKNMGTMGASNEDNYKDLAMAFMVLVRQGGNMETPTTFDGVKSAVNLTDTPGVKEFAEADLKRWLEDVRSNN